MLFTDAVEESTRYPLANILHIDNVIPRTAVTEAVAPGRVFTTAAEVGLLTRNIKIIGEDYVQQVDEAFGARVLVGSYTEDGDTFTGKLKCAT